MSPTPVQGSASVTRVLSPVVARRYAVMTESPSTLASQLHSTTVIDVQSGFEQEAKRRWQLHQQQNSPLSYTQKRGISHYQADQTASLLASLHIEI